MSRATGERDRAIRDSAEEKEEEEEEEEEDPFKTEQPGTGVAKPLGRPTSA